LDSTGQDLPAILQGPPHLPPPGTCDYYTRTTTDLPPGAGWWTPRGLPAAPHTGPFTRQPAPAHTTPPHHTCLPLLQPPAHLPVPQPAWTTPCCYHHAWVRPPPHLAWVLHCTCHTPPPPAPPATLRTTHHYLPATTTDPTTSHTTHYLHGLPATGHILPHHILVPGSTANYTHYTQFLHYCDTWDDTALPPRLLHRALHSATPAHTCHATGDFCLMPQLLPATPDPTFLPA